MNDMETGKFDNLANLSRELEKVEGTSIHVISVELTQARNGVVGALLELNKSRFHLGRALRQYKQQFKAERGWMAAAKLIAAAMNRGERTVYRIIEEFERASQLPPITLEAMIEWKIDPAAGKNAQIVENLLHMPEPGTREEANAAVSVAVRENLARKEEKKKAATGSTVLTVDEFTARVLKQFQDRYRSAKPQEKVEEIQYVLEFLVSTLRVPILELRQYGRPALVPKPVKRGVA